MRNAGQQTMHILRDPRSQQATTANQQERRRHRFDFVQHVAGQDQALAPGQPVLQPDGHVMTSDGIQTVEGLVENQQFGIVGQWLAPALRAAACRANRCPWHVAWRRCSPTCSSMADRPLVGRRRPVCRATPASNGPIRVPKHCRTVHPGKDSSQSWTARACEARDSPPSR